MAYEIKLVPTRMNITFEHWEELGPALRDHVFMAGNTVTRYVDEDGVMVPKELTYDEAEIYPLWLISHMESGETGKQLVSIHLRWLDSMGPNMAKQFIRENYPGMTEFGWVHEIEAFDSYTATDVDGTAAGKRWSEEE